MQLYVVDCETCGFTGPIVLIQYQLIDTDEEYDNCNNKNIVLHDVWGVTIRETMDLIECICDTGIIAFNLVFDWFHIQKLYNALDELGNVVGYDALPEDYINKYAELEPIARNGLCLKPKHALDLFLYARKGPFQSTMERRNIVIRKIPAALVGSLQKHLEKVIKIDDIYFARRKEYKEYNWDVEPCKEDPTFSDLTLRFKPSVALKVLAQNALGFNEVLTMNDVSPGAHPIEHGWAPFALAVCPNGASVNWRCKIKSATGFKRGYAWPGVINQHITHWRYHEFARQYAANDITYTRDLFYHFRNEKESTLKVDDNDSVLAAQIGSTRWRGFAINIDGIKELRNKAVVLSAKAPKAPRKVFEYISPYLSEIEIGTLGGSTKKSVLEALAKGKEPCMTCLGTGNLTKTICPDCKGSGHTNMPHPAARYAQECIDARKAQKEVELYDKLLEAGRLHASLKVIGTLSSRMSGADGLNVQGIKHDKYVREQFPLAFGDLVLVGGDFMSFEVSIIDSICNDPRLREELCRCAKCKKVWPIDKYATEIDCPFCNCRDDFEDDDGNIIINGGNEPCRQKFHGLFAMGLKPGITYDGVIATKGLGEDDLYDKGKRGGFAKFYGGNASTLVDRGVASNMEIAENVMEWFDNEFKGSRKFSEDIYDDFCSMRQPDGIGTAVEWHDPKPYVVSLLGFKRFFTLENSICKKLFQLANKLPPNWKEIKGICVRREREQTIAGAVMSALYAAAFNIQAKNMRAASNHIIQSTGAQITKELQCRLWALQPHGIHPWCVEPLNIHDEIMLAIKPELKTKAKAIVDQLVQDYRYLIPLIAIGWNSNMETWAEK